MGKFRFEHNNINVRDLEKSLKFYEEALELKESRRIVPEDGSFIIVYLSDGQTDHLLELTWLRDWDRAYNLGKNYVSDGQYITATIDLYNDPITEVGTFPRSVSFTLPETANRVWVSGSPKLNITATTALDKSNPNTSSGTANPNRPAQP